MTKQYVMGIDVGTNESKGVIVDEQCQIIASYTTSHELDNPAPNYFEQDAEKIWWKDVCIVSNALLQKTGIPAEQVKVLGTSALGCDCVPVDKNCKPLCKAILYGIDCRSHEEIAWLNQYYGEKADEIFGHSICSSDIAPKILWIKNHLPEVYENTYKFLTASSYLTAKLTDRYCIDKYLAEDFMPLYNLEHNTTNNEMCGLFCRPNQLAEILYATELAGEVTEQAAKETGLKAGTKVLTGTGDSGTEAISTGVFQAGDLMIQLGSTCYFVYLADRLISDNRVWPGSFIIPDTYSICAGTNTAGTLTKWFKQNFYFDKEAEEKQGGQNAFAAMSESIRDVSAGSDGLITLPYFAGERTPLNDPFAKGMIFGLQLNHTREHIYKSALEGIAYSIEQNLKIMEENGLPVKKIMAVGGGTKNESWLQIIADVLGKPVHTSKVSMGAAYGDALMASLSAGFFDNWEELSKVIKPASTYMPNDSNYLKYVQYKEVFKQLYEANKEFMHQM
ncbi:MAG: FGGY-family carbohydrate kinase [Lachnospiraceae bacterium]|nr:FGGY-family carbohydrate kinase [Lachnospiraceae bacterium]